MNPQNLITKNLRLLGQPLRILNPERKFGAANFYSAIQIKHDGEYDVRFGKDYEEVLLFTEIEIEQARLRAQKNPDDVRLAYIKYKCSH